MSTALAIAGVTQVLRDLLNDRFVNQNVAGQIGQSVTVSTMPPDKVVQQNGVEVTQLNLFLRQVTPNIGWRNEGLPSRDGAGAPGSAIRRWRSTCTTLISAYGAADLHAEILLGHAMQLLHENPVIPREAIRIALQPPPDQAGTLPPWLRALRDSGLQDQIEQLRITPEFLSTEDMSKFWTSTLAHYRPSAAYEVSVVLIQAEDPKPSPLPVLVRQARRDARARAHRADAYRGCSQRTSKTSSSSTSRSRSKASRSTALRTKSCSPTIVSRSRRRFQPRAPPPNCCSRFPRHAPPTFLRASIACSARVQKAGEPEPRVTNELALTVAPTISGLPMNVARVGGTASFTLNFTPAARVGQTVRLVLGGSEFAPQPFSADTTSLGFEIPDAPRRQSPGTSAHRRHRQPDHQSGSDRHRHSSTGGSTSHDAPRTG